MILHRSPLLVSAFAAVFAASSAHAVDFKSQLLPVLNQKCAKCHSKAKEVKGKFDINVPDNWKKQVNTLKPEVSAVLMSVVAPDDDDDVMPPKGKGTKMTPAEVSLLKQWISEGASFDAGGAKPAAPAAPASAPATSGPSKWTNTRGEVLDATFDRIEGSNVVLMKTDGVYISVLMEKLDAANQAQAKKAAGQ